MQATRGGGGAGGAALAQRPRSLLLGTRAPRAAAAVAPRPAAAARVAGRRPRRSAALVPLALAMPARAKPTAADRRAPSAAAAAAAAGAAATADPASAAMPPGGPRFPQEPPPGPAAGGAAGLLGDRRRPRRQVFTFERWETHRSSSRYFRHMSTVFRSRTFLSLSAPIALITAFAAFAGCYESFAVPGGWAPEINIGDVPLQITAFALSLLLTTRTESSNKRYEEALTVWSQVVRNESKDLARQSLYWVSEAQAPVRAALVRWTAAFSRALMCHCRPGGDAMLAPSTRGVLLPHESAALAAEGAGAAPAMVLQVLAELVEQADVPGIRRENMFSTLRELGSAVGRCEKLIRYPLPLAWTRHTSRFLIMWLLALPFALWEDCGWAVVPLTNLCGLLLLGIDHIGVELEDAMRAVDVEGICDDVSADVVAMLERQERLAGMLRDSGVATCESRACGRTWALGSVSDEESGAGGALGGGLLTLASLASGSERRGIAVMEGAAGGSEGDGYGGGGGGGGGRNGGGGGRDGGGALGLVEEEMAYLPAFDGGGLASGMSWDEDDFGGTPFGRYFKKAADAAVAEAAAAAAAPPPSSSSSSFAPGAAAVGATPSSASSSASTPTQR